MVELINNSEEQWGECSKDLEDGSIGDEVLNATATWKGQGSWTPAIFCFITLGRASRGQFMTIATTCTPDPSQLPLRKGDKVTLTCEHDSQWEKCDDDIRWKDALNEK